MALSNGLDGTNLPLQFLLPGFGRGEARGERKNMLATATRMLKDGVLALKDVARYSGLSLAQVKKLQASMAREKLDHRHHSQLTAAVAILGNVELHGLGSSINCLGRRVASYTTRDAKEIAKLPAKVP